MNKRLQGIVVGLLVGIMVSTGVVYAKNATDTVNRVFENVKITLDGKVVTPTDASGNVVEPFAIDGTNYLPVRAIGTALGLSVDWDAQTKTIILSTSKDSGGQQTQDGFVFSTKVTTTYNPIGEWTQTVGSVTNNSGKDYSTLVVSATYYGADGTILGKGTAFVQDIKVGQTKFFETLEQGNFSNAAKVVFQVDTKI